MIQQWDSLQEQVRSGGVSRRQFIAAAAALGISGAFIEGALAQTPKRGGKLIVGCTQGSSSDSLDPAKWSKEYEYVVGHQIHDTLTYANEKYELLPSLAESWSAKGGGVKEWVFKLRKGVTFHNGKTMTAADVVFSLNHHRNKTSMGRAMVSSVEEIKVTGPNEVTVTLNAGNADFPYFLAEFHMMIFPEGSTTFGIGTGPYMLESFQPGGTSRTKRYANDWDQNRGYVDAVETLHLGDSTARIGAVLSGAANIVTRVAPTAIAQLKSNPNTQIFTTPSASHIILTMACDRPPYANNLDLRMALKYAIDRDDVLKRAFLGYGVIGNDHPVPAAMNMYAAGLPQWKYDPDKAKFHLKKSGYQGPIVLTASDGAHQAAMEVAQIFQANARAVGMDFQINRLPASGYFTTFLDNPFFQSTFGGRPTADLMLSVELGANSPINESKWSHPKFEQLLVAGRSETNTAKRKQMYHDLQFLASQEAGSIIPIFTNSTDAATKNVRGYFTSPIQQLGAWRVTQKVWLDNA